MKFQPNLCIAVSILLFFSACLNDVKEAASSVSQTSKTIKNAEKTIDHRASTVETLSKLEPLTKSQWEHWSPETLPGGFNRTHMASNLMIQAGIASFGATYRSKENSKVVKITIMDGAGPKASGSIGAFYNTLISEFDTKHNWGYQRSVTENGIKAKETHFTGNNKYELTTFYGDRFCLTVETEQMEREEAWQMFEAMELEKLVAIAN
ncbi:hypothetical protein [Constantimarinum furrinae]|uniref:Uncharacterized protein n=1 Tax=Constantimarinum furrinae TaxID=2562285 RepID=A0A7G8PXZ8_9FLAO|nr:hypothetical protein [Constantimarinum furrinae]QNJ99214.1 hypothetical protein ALE3EI_2687 [Constantimarinum furrinae]